MADTTVEPLELTEYKTDHDLLIELRVLLGEMRRDMRDMKDGMTSTLTDHEKRIRSLEDTRKASEGRSGAFSWIGGIFYAVIALIAGIIGGTVRNFVRRLGMIGAKEPAHATTQRTSYT